MVNHFAETWYITSSVCGTTGRFPLSSFCGGTSFCFLKTVKKKIGLVILNVYWLTRLIRQEAARLKDVKNTLFVRFFFGAYSIFAWRIMNIQTKNHESMPFYIVYTI